MKKLAIITTHPIQYYAPIFRLLADRGKIQVQVYYTLGDAPEGRYDPGFGKSVHWDIDLLSGYSYEFVENSAARPGSDHFWGISNPDLISRIKAWSPDAVLVFGWSYRAHLAVLRYFKGKIPVYFRGDSTLLDKPANWKSALRGPFLKWVYGHIDHAFYVGANNKAYFHKYGVKDNRLSFAPHAVDNARFATDQRAEAIAMRRSLAVEDDEPLILFAGKLIEKKSPILLLNAFLAIENSSAHLLFVGNGSLEKLLKERAKDHPKVHFRDFENQSRMPVIYQACDLFVLPSQGPGETWGLAVNEAMASGRAVLLSDKVGCAADLVNPGVNGNVFLSGDIRSLTAFLEQMTASAAVLSRMGQNSRDMIRNWTFQHIVNVIENQLNWPVKSGIQI